MNDIPNFGVFLDPSSLRFNDVYHLVLLLNNKTHLKNNVRIQTCLEKVTDIIEQLCQFSQGLFYALDIFVSFLYFTVSSSRFAVSV